MSDAFLAKCGMLCSIINLDDNTTDSQRGLSTRILCRLHWSGTGIMRKCGSAEITTGKMRKQTLRNLLRKNG